jgi:TM2 domain-containing membrane protein YozV
MPEERICAVCGRSNPVDQPRCVGCGQRAQGVQLVAEEKPVASWWSSSSRVPGAIPPPPQVREEMARAEQVRLDNEKRQVERDLRVTVARERRPRVLLEREAAQALAQAAFERATTVAAVQADCARCGVPLEKLPGGQGFSFCLRCGADAPRVQNFAPPTQTQTYSGVQTVTNATVRGLVMPQASAQKSGAVSPYFAATASFLYPGIGQIVNGQAAKGVLLMLLAYFFLAVIGGPAMGWLALIGRGLAAVDAYRIAERRRSGASVRTGEWDLG